MNKLEAIADALSVCNDYQNPASAAYQLRNPGALKAISPRHICDGDQRRIFRSFLDGYQALLYDLKVKCSGQSRTGLKPTSTLLELVFVYGHTTIEAELIVDFLRTALDDGSISTDTRLSYFLTD